MTEPGRHRAVRLLPTLTSGGWRMDTLLTAIIVVVGVPAVVCGYIIATEWVIRGFSGPAKMRIRPWLWVLPAFLFLTIFLIYPTIRTFINSLFDRSGEFVGIQNYAD